MSRTENRVIKFSWLTRVPEKNGKLQSPLIKGENSNIGFVILIELKNKNQLSVTISKGYFEKARVKIKLSINQSELSLITDWEINYCFNEFPINSLNVGDALKIDCEITWFDFTHNLIGISIPNVDNKLLSYYLQNEFSDVTLIVEGKEIPAHKIILVSHSPVFLAMFQVEMLESIENKIKIDNMSISIMKEVLKFLYTGKTLEKFDVETALEVLAAADRYQIDGLKKYSTELLTKNLNIDNVCKIIHVADICNDNNLVETAMNYMITNKKLIIEKKEFNELSSLNPKLLHAFSCKIIQNSGSCRNCGRSY